MEKSVLKKCDYLITVSDGFLSLLNQHYDVENKSEIIYNGYDPEDFKKQSKIFANKLIEDKIPVRTLEVKNKNHFDVILDLADYDTPLGMELKMLLDFQD